MMLGPREAQRRFVDPLQAVHMGHVDRCRTEARSGWLSWQGLAPGAEEVDRHTRKDAVLDVERLRHAIECECDQRAPGRLDLVGMLKGSREQFPADAAPLLIG